MKIDKSKMHDAPMTSYALTASTLHPLRLSKDSYKRSESQGKCLKKIKLIHLLLQMGELYGCLLFVGGITITMYFLWSISHIESIYVDDFWLCSQINRG